MHCLNKAAETHTAIEGCLTYEYLASKTSWVCVQCELGLTGVAGDGGFTLCNATIQDCDDTVTYHGLVNYSAATIGSGIDLGVFASCYACLNNKIPTLFLYTNGGSVSPSFKPFNIDGEALLAPYTAQTIDGTTDGLICVEKTTTGLFLT